MRNSSDDAYEKALALLVAREHTRSELEMKLRRKGFEDDDVRSALDRLEREGSLDEKRFAEVFIRSRLRKNPEGMFLLARRLDMRGCRKSAYQGVLDMVFESGEYLPYLEAALEKSLRIKGREKTLSAFVQKGFKASLVENILDGTVNQD